MPVSPSYFGLGGFAFPIAEAEGCDYPDESDVKIGVVYGDGAYAGTYQLVVGPTSGTDHSPADILRWLLVGIGSLTSPTLSQSWPGYCSQEPNLPDNCVTTFDVEGLMGGREHHGGDRLSRKGVQIRIRSTNHRTGWIKADEIATTLDRSVLRDSIAVGESTYCVQSFRRTSDVIDLGKEVGASKRHLFVINGLLTVEKIS